MIFAVVFVITFIIGFAFGIAMPFIFKKINIYEEPKKTSMSEEPKSTSAEIIDEWLNGGKRGE